VVLMDCRMPGQGGVAATREIVLVRGMGGKVWVGDARRRARFVVQLPDLAPV
jgi:hypothetical protein